MIVVISLMPQPKLQILFNIGYWCPNVNITWQEDQHQNVKTYLKFVMYGLNMPGLYLLCDKS